MFRHQMKSHIFVCGLAFLLSYVAAREINTAGLNLIKEVEGWRACAYRDQVGAWTIGYGHLIIKSDGLCKPVPSTRCCITSQRGTDILKADLKIATNCISRIVHVPLTDNQFGALVSWTFNVGTGAASKSELVKKLNARDYNSVCGELKKYIHGGGRVIEGLVVRRRKECALFLRRLNNEIDGEQFDDEQNEIEQNIFEENDVESSFENNRIDENVHEIEVNAKILF